MSSSQGKTATSLAALIHERVQKDPQKTPILWRKSAHWEPLTWLDVERWAYAITAAFKKDGFRKGSRAAILSNSRPEWSLLDWSAQSMGIVVVPVYPSLLASEIEYILSDSGTEILFVEDGVQRAKVDQIRERLPNLRKVVSFENVGETAGFESFSQWAPLQKDNLTAEQRQSWRALGEGITPNDLASIVYTSGTSGVPKGAEISHGNFVSIIADVQAALPINDRDVTLVFLPLAHILGRVESMLTLGVSWTNAYAQNLKTMMEDILEVRPTILVAVPRIFEKIFAGVSGKVKSYPGPIRRLMEESFRFARHYSKLMERGDNIDLIDRTAHRAFDRALYSKVRDRFGGRIRFCISGGAPLSDELARFFHACGVLVLEGYGLTETTGPVSVNRVNEYKFGTVGKVLQSVEVKIAEDGEFLFKGGPIFKGYHQSPEANLEAFDNGFFKTGDIGEIDARGFLKITDRKKDLIVTAGGKNVAPQKIEKMLLENPLFTQAIVIGDKRKYLSVLLALDARISRSLADQKSISFGNMAELYENEKFQYIVHEALQKVNKELASYESLKRFRILPKELSVEAGELTPSLKIKRKYCSQKYTDLVEQMYN
jgi:long-chain acyl-CoA synthetase